MQNILRIAGAISQLEEPKWRYIFIFISGANPTGEIQSSKKDHYFNQDQTDLYSLN